MLNVELPWARSVQNEIIVSDLKNALSTDTLLNQRNAEFISDGMAFALPSSS
jgi:hypothetical protein